MDAPWFSFSFPDFAFSFLSVLLEGVPFILLGTLIAGFIDEFLPSKVMVRWLPRNTFLAVCLSASLGLVFPMCECGVVPIIRRLLGKGLPLSNAIAYMLAAPIVNPIVVISTYAAFRGQNPLEMTVLRLGVGFLVAVIAALAVHQISTSSILKPGVIKGMISSGSDRRSGGPLTRIGRALGVSVSDFLDVMIYFTLGVAIASVFNTAINQEVILPLALNDWIAVTSLMGLAGLLCLCSTSDAFIAATFVAFPMVSKLAFLVFGPMFDLKLLFIYSSVFRKRFVLGLGVGLFILIALICVRLNVITQ